MMELSNDNANDDDVERRNKRRSQRVADAPLADGRAGPLTTMSNNELTAHYEDCIKLSAEGKISSKNAFALHLIDYLEGLVQRDKIDNFQVASSSLDAGAKIYAGRVDAVHQEAYKVLGGLGRTGGPGRRKEGGDNDNDDNDDEDNDAEGNGGRAGGGVGEGGGGDGDDEAAALRRDKRKERDRRKKKSVLASSQQQLTRIRLKPMSLRHDLDPLFQQQAAAYDDGGTGELRLNNVRVFDNCCEILLDSDARLFDDDNDEDDDKDKDKKVPLTPAVSEALATVAREAALDDAASGRTICPAFRAFSFMSAASASSASSSADLDGGGGNNDQLSVFAGFVGNDDDDSRLMDDYIAQLPPLGADDDDAVNDNDDNDDNDDEQDDSAQVHVAIGDNTDQIVVQSAESTMNSTNFVQSLRAMLSNQLDGGDTAQAGVLRLGMWAGPDNWKRKCRLGAGGVAASSAPGVVRGGVVGDESNVTTVATKRQRQQQQQRKQKASVAAALLSEELADWRKSLGPSRAVIALSDAVVSRNMRQVWLLPPLHGNYEQRSLLHLVNDTKHVLQRVKTSHQKEVDEIQVYDFNSQRDADGFCPNVSQEEMPSTASPGNEDDAGGGNDDDDDDVDGFYDNAEDNDNPFQGAFTQVPTTEDNNAGSQQQQQQQQLDTLAEPPYKISHVDIAYAKTAKRINVKRLKKSMWQLLTEATPASSQQQQQQQQRLQQFDDSQTVFEQDMQSESKRSFAQLLQHLPPKVGQSMSKDLSIPIVFNCLLHLANEKTLHLSQSGDFADMSIAQGLPEQEIQLRKLLGGSRRAADTAAASAKRRQSTLKELWATGDSD